MFYLVYHNHKVQFNRCPFQLLNNKTDCFTLQMSLNSFSPLTVGKIISLQLGLSLRHQQVMSIENKKKPSEIKEQYAQNFTCHSGSAPMPRYGSDYYQRRSTNNEPMSWNNKYLFQLKNIYRNCNTIKQRFHESPGTKYFQTVFFISQSDWKLCYFKSFFSL